MAAGHVISEQWMAANASPRGGWSRAQLACLGLSWPLCSGWKKKVLGNTISDAAKRQFELLARATPQPATKATKAQKKALKKLARAQRAVRRAQASALVPSPARIVSFQPSREKQTHPERQHIAHAPQPPRVSATAPEFLQSYAWRQLRMKVLMHYGSRCMCCGATPSDGAVMNVDHIKPRKTHPHLALEFDNLQVLCGECNAGKGNWSQTDWRENLTPVHVPVTEEDRLAVQHLRDILAG